MRRTIPAAIAAFALAFSFTLDLDGSLVDTADDDDYVEYVESCDCWRPIRLPDPDGWQPQTPPPKEGPRN